ncbi:phosphatidylinositol 4,5-bisphosphate 5-phosphatase A-like [Patiria miniata]|uniref:Inositol polyphosphate-related phosphatase domain-containing protein n=1 Tax=Patiria miniata TaxID=46514 RepID=A0A914AJQ5_PATMI|nr:phosphatidylinositol 4,5-bisphosphate 5-phosphatase A-like [Patiria miniata]
MAMDSLVGLDSISSLDPDNMLSARSTSSLSSTDDVLSGNPSRKKKANTLSRLRKLKKPGSAILQGKVDGLASSSPISDIKDLAGNQLDKHINGNITDVSESVHETKESADSRIQDGREEISSFSSRARDSLKLKPSPSPRIKPRRIRPLDGTLDSSEDKLDSGSARRNTSELDSLIGPLPLARPTRVTPLDGEVEPITVKNGTSTDFTDMKKDTNSNSLLSIEPKPSPRVKPRRFANLGTDSSDIAAKPKERTEKRSVFSEEWSTVQDEQKTKEAQLSNGIFKPVSSSLDRVSMLPPLEITKTTLNENTVEDLPESLQSDKKPVEENIVPVAVATEEAILPQSSEIVQSGPAHLENLTKSNATSEAVLEEASTLDDAVNFDEDSDAEDLIVVPDNSPTKTSLVTTENIMNESIRRSSGDGESDPVDNIKGSRTSLRSSSDFLLPVKTSTPSKTELKQETSSQNTDDEEDLIVSTFADKANGGIEETITATQNQGEESVMKRVTPEELAAELNNLSEDETLRAPSESVRTDSTLREGGDIDDESGEQTVIQPTVNHTSIESGAHTEYAEIPRSDRPSPLIGEAPPSLPVSSADFASFKPDDIDNSVAMSEPILGTASCSHLSDTSRSFMSTGALSTITTRTARNKTYLTGGASTSGSLLSKEELERFFPDRKVKIFIATWNMCEGKVLPDNLEELLLPEDCVLVQDLYVIGTQESTSDGQEWEIRLQETLGPSHVLLHSATHGVLRLTIFIRRDLIWFCSAVEDDTVSTRAFSMIKTKGAVAAGFTFFGTSFLFINCHFTAGDEQIKERIADYEKIIKDLQLPFKVPPTRKFNNLNTDVTSRFDCIFWCGDFNFRLTENRAKVENWAGELRDGKKADYSILLKYDQLKKNMKKKSIFIGFHEEEIEFLPTYKYDIGGDVYDSSSKARVPSYTDRVLFKSRRSAQIHSVLYNACNSIKVSDHRPVYAMFEVKIRPGKDDSLTSGGVFSREVFNEANKRRSAKAAMSDMMMSQKSSAVCSVM